MSYSRLVFIFFSLFFFFYIFYIYCVDIEYGVYVTTYVTYICNEHVKIVFLYVETLYESGEKIK